MTSRWDQTGLGRDGRTRGLALCRCARMCKGGFRCKLRGVTTARLDARERPPARIVTARLTLRAWRPEDAPLMREAIDSSLAHLRPWMTWAVREPLTLEATVSLLERFQDDFAAGRDFHYGIFSRDEREVLGGTGLHPRIGPDAMEIGYWLREAATRRGYVTEAAASLTRVALEDLGLSRVEIHCDPRNVASARS